MTTRNRQNSVARKGKGQHSFAQIPSANIQRSTFNRSSGLKTDFDSGFLVPVFVDEALPGDTMNLKMSLFARMSTPVAPIMDNAYLDYFFFAVPIRLLWDNWQRMNGEQTDPGDSTDFLVPQIIAPGGGYGEKSLSDYLGIPTKVPSLAHSALWHRAYNLIYNEWFRDQNLQDSVVVNRDDGPDLPTDYVLLRRGKRHDYFTSALPFPQKGPAINMPLGGTAPVTGDVIPVTNGVPIFDLATSSPSGLEVNPQEEVIFGTASGSGSNQDLQWDDPQLLFDNGVADLSTATGATINELRESFQIQRMLERDARGGTRYTEVLRSHFGVNSPDQRLQRPEYLGGGSTTININPVAATAETVGGSGPVAIGELRAYGTASDTGKGFTKSFTEHCVLVGLACVRADLNYQQGLERMFSRRTRFDFYWPTLAHLGEQSILNKEIFADGTAADEDVFGYQERYAEYRYKPSKITGTMRSNASTSLDVWHLAQDFAALPVLDDTFIVENAPFDRVILAQDESQFLFDAYFEYKCARPMPVFSVPGLIDHF